MFNSFIYEPLYNTLVAIISFIPGHSVGLAIIVLTLLVKTILLPLSHKSTRSQAELKKIEPEVQKVRERTKDNKQLQAQEVMELYKKHGVNPFSGCLLIIIQLPIILGLYFVFVKGLPEIDPEALYSFVSLPDSATLNMIFLGIFDLAGKSWPLALAAAASQFFQMKISMPEIPKSKPKKDGEMDFKADLARNMTTQMRYVLPVVIFFVSYSISAAVALYWTVSNLFSMAEYHFVKRGIIEGEKEPKGVDGKGKE